MKKYVLIIILVIGFIVRLYGIDNPIADWHSWRQADTAAVTRNFYTFGFTPLTPRYDDLSNIQTGVDNPNGYRFVEFPLYQSVVYLISNPLQSLPVSLEMWHRIVSIAFSLGSIYLIYSLGKRFGNEQIGLVAAGFFAILPYSIYYSRAILPEVFLVFFTLLTLDLFARSIKQSSKHDKKQNVHINLPLFVLSAISGAIAILTKPVAVFFFIPLVYLVVYHRLFTRKYILLGLSYGFIMLSPFIAWRYWMGHFPEGIPAWRWLINGDQATYDYTSSNWWKWLYDPIGIRFKGAFFRWIFAERLTQLILGYGGIAFLMMGILAKEGVKNKLFFHALGLGTLMYVTVFAGGNVRHDYYQVIALPAIVFYVGMGVDFLLANRNKLFSPLATYVVIVSTLFFMLAFSWFDIRGYYWINNPAIVEAGKQADKIIPPNAKVIAPYYGDTAFLYQTRRQGWPIGFDIEDKRKKGATHYVSVTPQDPEVLDLKQTYRVLSETDAYIIIDLQ